MLFWKCHILTHTVNERTGVRVTGEISCSADSTIVSFSPNLWIEGTAGAIFYRKLWLGKRFIGYFCPCLWQRFWMISFGSTVRGQRGGQSDIIPHGDWDGSSHQRDGSRNRAVEGNRCYMSDEINPWPLRLLGFLSILFLSEMVSSRFPRIHLRSRAAVCWLSWLFDTGESVVIQGSQWWYRGVSGDTGESVVIQGSQWCALECYRVEEHAASSCHICTRVQQAPSRSNTHTHTRSCHRVVRRSSLWFTVPVHVCSSVFTDHSPSRSIRRGASAASRNDGLADTSCPGLPSCHLDRQTSQQPRSPVHPTWIQRESSHHSSVQLSIYSSLNCPSKLYCAQQ